MTLPYQSNDQRLALATLALDDPPPAPGLRPEPDELWDWMQGAVDEPRATEIRSHLARDSELYEQWRQLRQEAYSTQNVSARSNAPQDTRQGSWLSALTDWLSPSVATGGFATAAILVIAVSIGLQTNQAPRAEFWTDWQVPKSIGAVELSDSELPEMQSFLAGMRQQIWDMSLVPVDPQGRPLPREVPSCDATDSDCTQRRELLFELGQLSVLARWECVLAAGSRTDRLSRVREVLAGLESEQVAARLVGPLRDWATAEDQAQRCHRIDDLLSRGLMAQDLLSMRDSG